MTATKVIYFLQNKKGSVKKIIQKLKLSICKAIYNFQNQKFKNGISFKHSGDKILFLIFKKKEFKTVLFKPCFSISVVRIIFADFIPKTA